MKRLDKKPDDSEHLAAAAGIPELHHVFSEDEINAVNAALAARRPLLVRGEPGIGKSQLARAAAVAMKRAYVQFVVDVRTESSDLLWHFDAVARLAQAQIWGALRENGETRREVLLADLAVGNFVHPRALWWAFDWAGARAQATRVGMPEPPQAPGCDPANGCVVLIDEIDKAETDVPNGLLEALGTESFAPPGFDKPVFATATPPLVIITTNEERSLPDAFLRRCLVLPKQLPKDEAALKAHLMSRADAHFKPGNGFVIHPDVFGKAADLLIGDRQKAEKNHWLPLPGQAEYLDLVRAVLTLEPAGDAKQTDMLDTVARFALTKHPGATAETSQ